MTERFDGKPRRMQRDDREIVTCYSGGQSGEPTVTRVSIASIRARIREARS